MANACGCCWPGTVCWLGTVASSIGCSLSCVLDCCTPPHHACPCRRAGDFANNDEIYDAIDAASKEAQASHADSRSGFCDGRDVHIVTTTHVCRRLFRGLPVLLALLCCDEVRWPLK